MNKLSVSATPHIRDTQTIDKIMTDVLIALTPAALVAFYMFGFRAVTIMIVSVASCIWSEKMYNVMVKKPNTTWDKSCIVTGLLLAFNLPVSVPIWLPVVGSVFAILIAKMLFGGLGQNFMNPALAARAFLQISFAKEMVAFTEPVRSFFSFELITSSATPLGLLKKGVINPTTEDYLNALVGSVGGSIGETCAIALIVGGVYLIYKKIISYRIPFYYITTFMLLSFAFGRNGLFTGALFYEVLVGGVLLGAFFMATDYSSCPITPNGQVIFACGCGVLTYVIRTLGGYPEGVCYSILLMNLTVPLIDKYTKPRVYGVFKGGKKHA